jgi:hypothetical protein
MLIKEVFEQFLAEQQSRLAPKTYRDYASVIELFEHRRCFRSVDTHVRLTPQIHTD